jgi:HEAT repeat protein
VRQHRVVMRHIKILVIGLLAACAAPASTAKQGSQASPVNQEAKTRDDCSHSTACRQLGTCRPRNGGCVAAADDDCQRSLACTERLRCTARAGECVPTPDDPRALAENLRDERWRQAALDQLARMGVERARVAVPALVELYRETKKPEHLEALERYRDVSLLPLFVEALEFSEDDFDGAVVAASALATLGHEGAAAVPALVKATLRPLPIKSRANAVRLAAIRALVKIGDKRAVPALSEILTTSADEQDFLLNMKAALGLAELADPAAVPALIKGMFMTGRGANIFQECRLALVRIGKPAVKPLIELLDGRNAEINAMAKQLDFAKYAPGIVPFKAAYVLGDLRDAEAVPALAARLKIPAESGEHRAILIALGFIGGKAAVDALVKTLKDRRVEAFTRLAAEDGLYLSGDGRAVPVLLAMAGSTAGGTGAADLRVNAAVALARIAGPEHYARFKAWADKPKEGQNLFGEALERMEVARTCGDKLECYGESLADPSWLRAEKAALFIGFAGDAAKGLPLLTRALKPVASLRPERLPVQQAILQSLARLATKHDQDVVEALQRQIARDENAVRLPGARDLLGETRVTLAIIQSKP